MPDTEYQLPAAERATLSRPAEAGLPAEALPTDQVNAQPGFAVQAPSLPPQPGSDAPLTTAGADQPQLFPAATLDTHPLIAALVPAVQATTEPANWAMTAATILQSLAPLQSQVFAVSRASTKTQTQINLAEIGVVTLAGILQMFFPHPRAG